MPSAGLSPGLCSCCKGKSRGSWLEGQAGKWGWDRRTGSGPERSWPTQTADGSTPQLGSKSPFSSLFSLCFVALLCQEVAKAK